MSKWLFQSLVVALLVGNAALTIYAHLEKKMTDKEVSDKLDAVLASQAETNAALTEAAGDIDELKDLIDTQTATIAELRTELENGGMSAATAAKLEAVESGQAEIDAKAKDVAAIVPEPVPDEGPPDTSG